MKAEVVSEPQTKSVEEVNQQVSVLQLVDEVIRSGQAETALSDDFVESSSIGNDQAEALAVAYEEAAEERDREAAAQK
jgi:hypothetical protein